MEAVVDRANKVVKADQLIDVNAYDALNRLLAAQTTSTYSTSPTHCWGEAYQFDNQTTGGAWGNLTSIGVASSAYTGCTQESLSVTATAQNRISTSGYVYDTAGNMTANSGATYTYDAENHLTSTAGVNYTYDGDGKRIQKSNGKIYWYGLGGDVLDETDLTGSTTNSSFNEYVFFGGRRIARRDSSNNVLYYFADHLGTSRVNAQVLSGQTTATLCYDADFYPFGGERTPYTNTCSQTYKFTGKERDNESNLDNFGARYNASTMGRFMSPDPLMITKRKRTDPQDWDMYSYTRNNPLRFTDPTGMYTTGCTQSDISKCDQNTQNFETARQQALKSKDKDVRNAAKAYGNYGDKNGVTVGFMEGKDSQGRDTSRLAYTEFSRDSKGQTTGISVQVGVDLIAGATDAQGRPAQPGPGSVLAEATVAHEGKHVADRTFMLIDPGITMTNRQAEIRAYGITNAVVKENSRYASLPQGIDFSSDDGINRYLDANPQPEENLDDLVH